MTDYCYIPQASSADPDSFEDWGEKARAVGKPGRESGIIYAGGTDGDTELGVWQCTPGRWRTVIERDEFCHILLGKWRLTLNDGTVIELLPGDSFFMPAGFEADSEILETVRKIYCVSGEATQSRTTAESVT